MGTVLPGTSVEDTSSLGELVELARRRHRDRLAALLETRLSVDGESLPEFYRLYFEFPWLRVYTLNVDDLELAADRRFSFDRKVESVVADARAPRGPQIEASERLEVVHLNGRVGDRLGAMTFSEIDYARRVASREPWYMQCAADITSRPTVFVGTLLNEAQPSTPALLATEGPDPSGTEQA